MRIGVITTAFNEPDFIGPCIKQFDGFFFPHIVLVSKKPWRGDHIMDDTWLRAKMELQNGEVITDIWANQADHVNVGLQILESYDVDWALIVDVDEFYTPADIGRLVGQIRTTEYDALYATHMNVYWKTPSHLIVPEQFDYPIIAIKTNKRFLSKRHVDNSVTTTGTDRDLVMHHMSYVRTDKQMKKKIESFEHANEFDTDTWYNNVWLPWTKESRNLHPVVPTQFQGVVVKPAPDEIMDLLYGIPV